MQTLDPTAVQLGKRLKLGQIGEYIAIQEVQKGQVSHSFTGVKRVQTALASSGTKTHHPTTSLCVISISFLFHLYPSQSAALLYIYSIQSPSNPPPPRRLRSSVRSTMRAFLSPPPLPFQSQRSQHLLCTRTPPITRTRVHVTLTAPEEVKPREAPLIPDTPPDTPLTSAPPIRPSRPRPRQDNTLLPPPVAFAADPDATYYTKCGACQASYQIDPQILSRGKKVACAVCANEWFQKPDRLLTLKETEGLKAYPMEDKDDLMKQSAQIRRDRRSGRPDRRTRNNSFSVFIGNLPFALSEEELAQFVGQKATPTRITIVKDQETGRSRGFAFAHFTTEEEVNRVVNELDGQQVDGRNVTVKVGKRT